MTDISVTATSVAPGTNAQRAIGTAGASITAGQALYADATASNTLKPADADAGAATAAAVGIALHAAASGQPVTYLTSGQITIGGTVQVGRVYVVSANAGFIAPQGDLATGWYTTVLGIGITTGIIDVSIKAGGVAYAA